MQVVPVRSGEQFGKQLLAATGCAVYSFVVGYALIKVIGLFMEVVPERAVIASVGLCTS
jgi:ammonia channel protein AmtB